MLFNIMVGFIIPWISGIVFYFKDRKILFAIVPFKSMIAFIVNSIACFFGFWSVYPHEYGKFATVPYDLGAFPILSVYLIHYIDKTNIKPCILITIAIICTTMLEWLAIITNVVVYANGWNLGLTFINHVVAYFIDYWYYKQLKKMDMI